MLLGRTLFDGIAWWLFRGILPQRPLNPTHYACEDVTDDKSPIIDVR